MNGGLTAIIPKEMSFSKILCSVFLVDSSWSSPDRVKENTSDKVLGAAVILK
jgi:hypothetical protein